MKKAYFQYYETFEDILAKIKDDVKREAFRRVIIRYGLYGTVPTGLTEIEDLQKALFLVSVCQSGLVRHHSDPLLRRGEGFQPLGYCVNV